MSRAPSTRSCSGATSISSLRIASSGRRFGGPLGRAWRIGDTATDSRPRPFRQRLCAVTARSIGVNSQEIRSTKNALLPKHSDEKGDEHEHTDSLKSIVFVPGQRRQFLRLFAEGGGCPRQAAHRLFARLFTGEAYPHDDGDADDEQDRREVQEVKHRPPLRPVALH